MAIPADADGQFVIAKNPNAQSALPYLLCLPLGDAPLWLKAKERWPRKARVYCEAIDTPTHALEIIERLDVTLCARRGKAIDLVLSRATNKRSQFIFTESRGRPMILWQTANTAKATRAGVRVPVAHASAPPVIYIDTRERYPYDFAHYGARAERGTLAAGDYAVMSQGEIVGAVERKAFADFARSLTDGSLMFAMAGLAGFPVAAVAVEGSYSSLLRHRFTASAFLSDVLVRLQIRYPHVPVMFLETKKLAEDWTYRFLRDAYDAAQTLALPLATSHPKAR